VKLRYKKNPLKALSLGGLLLLLTNTPLLSEEKGVDPEPGIVPGRNTNGLSIALISECTSIKSGEPFQVALKIEHDEKFHTYWKNPGIVGIATGIEWTLPPGFTASDIQWPYPELSEMSSNPCYGYARDILLLVTITPPETISELKAHLEAKTKWMCCGRTGPCYPGFKTFKLSLPVGDRLINESTTELFDHARKNIPVSSKQFSASLVSKPDTEQIEVVIKSTKKFTPIRIFNSDGQHGPEIRNTLSKVDDSTWKYSTTRAEHSRADTSKFPFLLQTKTGYYNLVAK